MHQFLFEKFYEELNCEYIKWVFNESDLSEERKTSEVKEHSSISMFKDVNDYIELEKKAGRCDTDLDLKYFTDSYYVVLGLIYENVLSGYIECEPINYNKNMFVFRLTDKGVEYMNIVRL